MPTDPPLLAVTVVGDNRRTVTVGVDVATAWQVTVPTWVADGPELQAVVGMAGARYAARRRFILGGAAP